MAYGIVIPFRLFYFNFVFSIYATKSYYQHTNYQAKKINNPIKWWQFIFISNGNFISGVDISVTMWLDYISTFFRLQQWKKSQYQFFAKIGWKFGQILSQRHSKYGQSGEIWSYWTYYREYINNVKNSKLTEVIVIFSLFSSF